MIENKTV